MSMSYPGEQYILTNKQCPSPKAIDFDVYAMGGCTVALDQLRGETSLQHSAMSLEELVTALNAKLITVTEELHYYERVVNESQFPALGYQEMPASIFDGSKGSKETSNHKAPFEELQEQIDQIVRQIIFLKKRVDNVLLPVLPTFKVHAEGLLAAFERYNKALQRENDRERTTHQPFRLERGRIPICLDVSGTKVTRI